MCAWFHKKRDGLGSILGNSRLFFTFDESERTLSWAKQPGDNPKGSIKFTDIVSVQSMVNVEDDALPEAGDQNSNASSQRPSSRSSSVSSRKSLTARVRSLSPFRKAKPQEYVLMVTSSTQQMELRCDSASQVSQWLAALEAVVANSEGLLDMTQSSTNSLRESEGVEQVSSLRASAGIEQGNATDLLQDPVQHIDLSSSPRSVEAVKDFVQKIDLSSSHRSPAAVKDSVQHIDLSSSHRSLEAVKAPRTGTWCVQEDFDASTACSSQIQSRAQSQRPSCSDASSRDRSHTPPDSKLQEKNGLMMEDFGDGTQIHIETPRLPELLSPATLTILSCKSSPAEATAKAVGEARVAAERLGAAFVAQESENLVSGPRTSCSSPKLLEQPSLESPSSSDAPAKQQRQLSKPPRRSRKQGRSSSPNPQRNHKVAKEEEEGETRKMFDKRELRRRNREVFENQLCTWREKNPRQTKTGPAGLNQQRVRVCVRKRPLFSHEENEFDTITVNGNEMVVHNCLTKADLKSLFVSHMGFHFARAFGESSDDTEVYKHSAEPAVHYALQGGSATIFMFGQTGSGKTHTMQALLGQASSAMFGSAGFDKAYIGAFEVAGKSLRDLQDPEHPDKGLKIMMDVNAEAAQPGQLEEQHSNKLGTRVQGLKWTIAESAHQLLNLCHTAQEQRATRATQANSVSSRSHSVIRIGRSEDDICLTLVDCAGSERNEDSTHHNAQDRKDAADINSTIFTLKECFRIMCEGKKQQPPFRNSLLTRVLADSFINDRAHVVAIGTVSPSSKDTEHSIETLRSLQMLQGTQMTFEKKEEIKADNGPMVKHPRTWSEEEVRSWFGGAAQGRAACWQSGLPKNTDGKMFVRMPAARFSQICGNNKELGDMIIKELREEMKRADESRMKRP